MKHARTVRTVPRAYCSVVRQTVRPEPYNYTTLGQTRET